jgi:hypothetical protein
MCWRTVRSSCVISMYITLVSVICHLYVVTTRVNELAKLGQFRFTDLSKTLAMYKCLESLTVSVDIRKRTHVNGVMIVV